MPLSGQQKAVKTECLKTKGQRSRFALSLVKARHFDLIAMLYQTRQLFAGIIG